MTWLVLATEDELSETVGLCLAAEAGLEVGQQLRRGGFGYLKSRLRNFCEIALHQPVFLLTDLDRMKCASTLVDKWMGDLERPENFVFRVAVREIESWLLADHDAIRSLLGKRIGRLPLDPDSLPDPKQALLALAARAPRDIRDDLVATEGALASQGLGYNAQLCHMVRQNWRPARAADRSPSLAKARKRLKELAERIG
ncbi:DUF4276 family protein [Variovorax atrisoli]|jgi:hypothetical protein|uniref:DUF4276 family protein n=1 Tax=Variovorax atrisoli TaxID=3394203 RepID=UPI000F7EBD54|nr:DUF4276 family protein [Variovorax sp. 369]RTD97891.1 DUF4276 family protein [Variovorax sp. 369]